MKTDRLFIGIDSGTQGTKAVLFSEKKEQIIAQVYSRYGMTENDQGGREQDPSLWTNACENVIAAILEKIPGAASSVKGIGVSGQQHGMVPLDKDGQVIRPAKLWCDTETTDQCRTLTQTLGGDKAVVNKTGNRMAEGFTTPKILWMKENEPHNYERLETVLLPHDYINFHLTGEKKTEFGDASGTAYFDITTQCWSKDVINAIDPSGKLCDCLPSLIPSGEPNGIVKKSIADKFGFSSDTLVSSGGGDNMMAAIGTGNVTPGIVTASLGTSGTIYAYADQPVIDIKGEFAAFCSSTGGWLPLICTMNVTVATELVRNLFNLDLKGMNDLIKTADPGSNGVILLPYFNGERTPALPKGKGTFSGLTPMNFTRENICRAAMEGATMGLRYGMDLLKTQGLASHQVRLTGGGAKSDIWRQMAADMFNCQVISPVTDEAGALGAALQACWCWYQYRGQNRSIESITDQYVKMDPDSLCEPDKNNTALYDQIFEKYMQINTALTPVFQ